MKKLSLNLSDRYHISILVPQSSNLINLGIWQDIVKKITISEVEWDSIKENGKIDKKKAEEADLDFVEYEFSDSEINLIKSRIDELDKKNEILFATVKTCQKIKNT